MIQFLLIECILRAARESGKDGEKVIIELDEFTLKLVGWVLVFLLLALLVWVFTDPQFCFRRQLQDVWDTIIKIC